MVRRCVKRCAIAGVLQRVILPCDGQADPCCARTHCRAIAHTCRSSCVGSHMCKRIICPAPNRIRTTYVIRKACTRGNTRVRTATNNPWLPLDLAVRAQAMHWSRQIPTSRDWRQRQGGVCSTETSSIADFRRSLQAVTPGPRLLSQQTPRFRTVGASPTARPQDSEASDDDMARSHVAPDDMWPTLIEGSR